MAGSELANRRVSADCMRGSAWRAPIPRAALSRARSIQADRSASPSQVVRARWAMQVAVIQSVAVIIADDLGHDQRPAVSL